MTFFASTRDRLRDPALAIARAPLLFLAGVFALAGMAQAAAAPQATKPVYRCAEGARVIYADEPCAHRPGRVVDVNDARTPAERRAAVAAANRTSKFAHSARAQRLADERHAAKLRPAGVRMPPRPKDEEVTKKRQRGVGYRKATKPKAAKFADGAAPPAAQFK